MDKAPDAFRTISEVADELDIPAHVLRFWETRFVQIKPMKRSGGRRYYRPDDVHLLRGIRRLLYGEGYTIRGVQRILREHGIKAVQGILGEESVVPPSFAGPSFAGDKGRRGRIASHDGDDDAAETFDAPDFEDDNEEDDAPPPPPARGAMDFVPSDHRLSDPVTVRPVAPASAAPKPIASRPVAEIPVAAMPMAQNPFVAASPAPGHSGAEAYAPPSLRKGARLSDKGRLQAVLEDLIGARELLDQVIKRD